jgi:hypothetical protein
MKLHASLGLAVFALGCGSAPPPKAAEPVPVPVSSAIAPAAAPEPPAAEEEAAPSEPAALPTACAEGTNEPMCMPDVDFAKRLCGGVFPDVALTLLGKDQPWTRMYMTGDYEAWNASGGMATRARLAFDEEVLVVAHRQMRPGGIVMTGAGATYDVLRWDGTCVSVEANEITQKKPPQPRAAPIPWRRLGEATRIALLSQPKVQAGQKLVEKECGAAPTATGAKAAQTKCDRADAAFDKAIVDFVRSGGALPAPARRP